jgi:hypothetical protein
VPRTQTKINAIARKIKIKYSICPPPIKIIPNKNDISKILAYSASIIKANPPLLYSVL